MARNNSDNIPVYILMPKTDAYDITLLAMMDMFLKCLKNKEWDRNGSNTRRFRRLQQAHDILTEVEQGYIGVLPEEFVNKAGKFCDWINADLRSLMQTMRG